MPRLTVPIPVPPGHSYCHGCKAALPVDRFAMRQGRPLARCRPCRKAQDALAAETRRMLHDSIAEWKVREAERQAAINAAYVPPSPEKPATEREYRGLARNPFNR